MGNLVCKGLCKNYKDVQALKDVDLELERGRIYGLIGRNGAGKTTLLSLLSGQAPATAGEITLDGEKVWEHQKQLDQICFSRELNVSATSGVGAMKIRDYLKAARFYFPGWNAELETQLVSEFGIPVKKALSKVNKGMQSMVTITVALCSGCAYTFLDEPVGGLDVIARERFYQLLLDEFSNSGRTFLISTHIIEEAASVFEQVIIVDKGRILLKEDTDALVGSARQVSGYAETVDAVTAGLEQHHVQSFGRSKSVVVFLSDGRELPAGYDVDIQGVSLQQVFVALCGEE